MALRILSRRTIASLAGGLAVSCRAFFIAAIAAADAPDVRVTASPERAWIAAVADGVVVAASDRAPDDRTFDPATIATDGPEGLPSLFGRFDRFPGTRRVHVRSGRVNSGDLLRSRQGRGTARACIGLRNAGGACFTRKRVFFACRPSLLACNPFFLARRRIFLRWQA
jgi:hypothetical protein